MGDSQLKDQDNRKPGPRAKKDFRFKLAAVLLVFVFFALMEGILRLSGFGTDYPLFVPDENHSTWVKMNPEISKKYFGRFERGTIGFQERFKEEKDPETFRIFVLGASTAVGYPYRKNGSFHRWLQFGLNATYPDEKIEVINLGLTAVNSYTLLDFTKQLLAFEPDALLIYAGHNEYYGALGAGTSKIFGNNPWLVNLSLSMKKLRLVQCAESIVEKVTHISSANTESRSTLMEKMAADRRIVLNSKKYQMGLEQFSHNFERIAELTKTHKVPVFLSSLVSNEKDQKPFMGDGTNPETSANHYFNLAIDAEESGNIPRAKENYTLAKDHDQLRFRAPEAINFKIRRLTDSYNHIYFVDTQSRFTALSKDGIIGNTFLWEHVHPNWEGYSLLAHTFYEEILKSGLIRSELKKALSWPDLKRQMPMTKMEAAAGRFEIWQLKEGWPFQEPMPKINRDSLGIAEQLGGKLAAKLLNWEEAMRTLYGHYKKSGDLEMGFRVMEGLILEYPQETQFCLEAALLAMQLKKTDKAKYYFKKAHELDSSEGNTKRIALTLVEYGAFEDALPYLEYLKASFPDDGQSFQIHRAVSNIVNQEDVDRVILAESYLLLRKRAMAIKVLNEALVNSPNNSEARELLKQID